MASGIRHAAVCANARRSREDSPSTRATAAAVRARCRNCQRQSAQSAAEASGKARHRNALSRRKYSAVAGEDFMAGRYCQTRAFR